MQGEPKTMKHRTKEISSRTMHIPLHPDEYEVCQIFIQLPRLIAQSETRHKFPLSWGAKRRRSAMEDDSTAANTKNDAVSSPSTPLSFLPSELDENPKLSKNKFPLQMNEEWLEIVDGLTQCRELLKMELENKRRHFERLKAFNIELIAQKQELSIGMRREDRHLVIGSLNPLTSNQFPTHENEHQISIINLHQSPFTNVQLQMYSKVEAVKLNVSPLGIPDLNVSPLEHCEEFEENFAAESKTQSTQRDGEGWI